MNYKMFYRTVFFSIWKSSDTKELLYSVFVKYYDNVLYKKKKRFKKSLFLLICWNELNTSVMEQSVLHILYITRVVVLLATEL